MGPQWQESVQTRAIRYFSIAWSHTARSRSVLSLILHRTALVHKGVPACRRLFLHKNRPPRRAARPLFCSALPHGSDSSWMRPSAAACRRCRSPPNVSYKNSLSSYRTRRSTSLCYALRMSRTPIQLGPQWQESVQTRAIRYFSIAWSHTARSRSVLSLILHRTALVHKGVPACRRLFLHKNRPPRRAARPLFCSALPHGSDSSWMRPSASMAAAS